MRGRELALSGEVRQIAGQGDMIRTIGGDIGGERIQHARLMLAALAAPGDRAEQPLGYEVGRRQRASGRL